MKTIAAVLGMSSALALTASAQVYINELMVNAPGADGGMEMFELRGTANMSLANHYLISLEGEGATAKGDVNQFMSLGGASLGANGFLVGRQFGSPYGAINPNATLFQPPAGPGWTWSGVYSTDGTGSDMENSATTILLVDIGSGAAPTLTLDMDADNDGVLEVPTGWTIVDSVGLIDSVGAAAENLVYGAVNFRIGTLGGANVGNLIQIPGGTTTSLYVARRGDTTGSTANDWFGAGAGGSGGNFVLSSTIVSDPYYAGKSLADMAFGGPNPIPEPGTAALLGLGALALFLRRK